MSKIFKIFLVLILSFIFCIGFVYASDVTMDLPNNDISETSNEDISNDESADANTTNTETENSLSDEYLNGAMDNTALPEDPLSDAYTHEQAVGISTNSSGLSVSSIINILLIAVGIIIIFLAIAIIIRLK